jgi:hypothetical protein
VNTSKKFIRRFTRAHKFLSFARGIAFACALFVLHSCGGAWSEADDNFVQAYTEILIAREQYAHDSAQANAKVRDILANHRFSESSFRLYFQKLAQKPERLRQMLDTARNRAKRIGDGEAEKEREQKEQKEKEQKIQENAAPPKRKQ